MIGRGHKPRQGPGELAGGFYYHNSKVSSKVARACGPPPNHVGGWRVGGASFYFSVETEKGGATRFFPPTHPNFVGRGPFVKAPGTK